jgi:anti-anti-sigma regulatory factor
LIFDLSGVDFLGVDGLRALLTISEQCAKANRRWALISSDVVNVMLKARPAWRLFPR